MTEFKLDFTVLTDFMFNLERGFCVYKNGILQSKPWKPACLYKSDIIYPKSGILICHNVEYLHMLISALQDKDQEFYKNYPEDFLYRSTKQRSPVCFKKQLIPTEPEKSSNEIDMGTRKISTVSFHVKADRFTWKMARDYKKQYFCSILIVKKAMVIMNRDSFYEFHKELPVLTVANVISKFVNLVELKNKKFAMVQRDLVNTSNRRYTNYFNIIKILKLEFPDKSIMRCEKCNIPLLNDYAIDKNDKKTCLACKPFSFIQQKHFNPDYKIICAGTTIKGVPVSIDERDFIIGIFEFLNGYKKKQNYFTDKKLAPIKCDNCTASMFSGGNLGERLAIINAVGFAKSLVGIFQAPETDFLNSVKKKLSEKTFIM